MVSILIHPVAPVGPTPAIQPPVFIAPRLKAIAESIHRVPMAKANKLIRQIVRVALMKIVFCPLATCFVTNHWVNVNQPKTISSLVIILQQSLDLSATTPTDHCHTLQHLHVFVVKKMGAPVQTGCIATHQIPNVKQYPIQVGFRPAIR